jgi:SAM-dependent methyltransferase
MRFFSRRKRGIEYWEKRAAEHGARSVLNLTHGAGDIDAVTRRQIEILFPLLRSQLEGRERLALDFGCGTGRFSIPLAEAIGGRVIAVDPIQSLIDLAPAHPQVEYRRMSTTIPMANASADLIWVCLVLGAIVDPADLSRAVAEIDRVLAPRGLLFLVENTAEKRSIRHFSFRSEAEYAALFPTIALSSVGEYEDAGERISVLAGRKRDVA